MPCIVAPVALAARLLLNEILVKPLSGGSEWIEILNDGDLPAPLAGLSIEDARGRPARLPATAGELGPGAYLLLAANRERVLERFPLLDPARVVKPDGTWPTLNDSDGEEGFADRVVLRDSTGARIDSLAYPARWLGDAGRSLERVDPRGPTDLAANWAASDDPSGATPLARNSLAPRPGEEEQGALIVPRRAIRPAVAGGAGAAIGWRLPKPAQVAIELFDLSGRSIRLLRPLGEAGTAGRVAWDGRTDVGQVCAPGIYMVLLEGRMDGETAPRRWYRPLVVAAGR